MEILLFYFKSHFSILVFSQQTGFLKILIKKREIPPETWSILYDFVKI